MCIAAMQILYGYNNTSMNAYGEQRDVYRPPYYGQPNYYAPVEK